MQNLFKQHWFNASLLSFLTHDNYVNLCCTNKTTYIILKNICKNRNENTKKKIYQDLCLYLMNKNCSIYGGVVRDYILDVCPQDIDAILPEQYNIELAKELFTEMFTNQYFYTDENLLCGFNVRSRLINLINTIEQTNLQIVNGKIDVNKIVKKVLTYDFNLDILWIKKPVYIFFNWNVMYSIGIFYCGEIIKLDLKFTNDDFEGDFRCNVLAQTLINGKLCLSTLTKRCTVEECVQDCKNKIAHPIIHKLDLYVPYIYCTTKYDCKKMHISTTQLFFKRIQKMISKGFVVHGITCKFSSENLDNIVPLESCSFHCEDLKKICLQCKEQYIIKKKNYYSYNTTYCTTCINVQLKKKCCDVCNKSFHFVQYKMCYNCAINLK